MLVKGGEHVLIGEREKMEDLLRGQSIPSWLKNSLTTFFKFYVA